MDNKLNLQIKDVTSKLLGQKDFKIEKINSGRDSQSYWVNSKEREYVLRTSGVSANYDVEGYILSLLRSKGLKVPIQIAESVDVSKYPFTFPITSG